jgi:hypothetical protein
VPAQRQTQERAHRRGVERPIQLAPVARIAQYRHAGAIALLELRRIVHPLAVEIRRAPLGHHGEGLVAQVAVIALVEDEVGHAAANGSGRRVE